MSILLSANASTSFLSSVELTPDQVFEGKHRLVCVEEDGMSSSFVLHFLLAEFLNWNSSRVNKSKVDESSLSPSPEVVLVLTANTLSHWTVISSRIGPQLTRLIQTGQIKVLDPLGELFSSLVTSNSGSNDTSQLDPLSNLYNSVEKLQPSLVIIEDLQFFSAACSHSGVLRFIAKLKRLPMSTVIGQVPQPVGQIFASTRFVVTALETGASSNVSAVLHVTSAREMRSYHYKLDERSIKLSFVPRVE